MLIEVLLIITLIWKQPKYPSTGEWINKWMHLYNRILLSNKRNELLIHSYITWLDLKTSGRKKPDTKEYRPFKSIRMKF